MSGGVEVVLPFILKHRCRFRVKQAAFREEAMISIGTLKARMVFDVNLLISGIWAWRRRALAIFEFFKKVGVKH
jgi:hypothetical protein